MSVYGMSVNDSFYEKEKELGLDFNIEERHPL